jgi:hypothetical protein
MDGWVQPSPPTQPPLVYLNERTGPRELCPPPSTPASAPCDAPTHSRGFPANCGRVTPVCALHLLVQSPPSPCPDEGRNEGHSRVFCLLRLSSRPEWPVFSSAPSAARRPRSGGNRARSLPFHKSLGFAPHPVNPPPQLFQRFVIPIFINPNYNIHNPLIPGGTRPLSWTKRNFSSSHSPV